MVLMKGGSWLIRWSVAWVSFVPRWANPLWQLTMVPVASEEAQIRDKLDKIVEQQLMLAFGTWQNDSSAPRPGNIKPKQ